MSLLPTCSDGPVASHLLLHCLQLSMYCLSCWDNRVGLPTYTKIKEGEAPIWSVSSGTRETDLDGEGTHSLVGEADLQACCASTYLV